MRRKTFWYVLAALPFLAGGTLAIEVGDPVEAVHDELGEPAGYMRFDATETFYYDRGKVVATDGIVTLANLVSAEEAHARKIEEQQQEAERQLLAKQRAARLYTEGLAVKEMQLNDPSFSQATANDRVAYWREFRKRYPGVDVSAEYGAALEEQAHQLSNTARVLEQDAKIGELERRVRDAEERARLAQQTPTYVAVPAYTHTSYYNPGYRSKYYTYNTGYSGYSHGYNHGRSYKRSSHHGYPRTSSSLHYSYGAGYGCSPSYSSRSYRSHGHGSGLNVGFHF